MTFAFRLSESLFNRQYGSAVLDSSYFLNNPPSLRYFCFSCVAQMATAFRLCKATGDPSIKSASEIAIAAMSPWDLAADVLIRPIVLNFQEPIVLVLNIYIGLIYALLYIWFEFFPIVFISIYHWKEQLLDLSFFGIFIGALIVVPPFFTYLYCVQEPKYNEKGELKPEERMANRNR